MPVYYTGCYYRCHDVPAALCQCTPLTVNIAASINSFPQLIASVLPDCQYRCLDVLVPAALCQYTTLTVNIAASMFSQLLASLCRYAHR